MFPRLVSDSLGDMFMYASFGEQPYLNLSNAEAIVQLANRKTDFQKPIEVYKMVDMYGPSILTLETDDWKRHRKIVAPAFSEKSNALVWEESLRQAQGMVGSWSRIHGYTTSLMVVKDTSEDTQMLALHVISSAGFGVPQVWPGEDATKLQSKTVPGFNTTRLLNSHTMAFRDSLNTMLHSIIWLALVPVWLLG